MDVSSNDYWPADSSKVWRLETEPRHDSSIIEFVVADAPLLERHLRQTAASGWRPASPAYLSPIAKPQPAGAEAMTATYGHTVLYRLVSRVHAALQPHNRLAEVD